MNDQHNENMLVYKNMTKKNTRGYYKTGKY